MRFSLLRGQTSANARDTRRSKNPKGNRPGSDKRSKLSMLAIHETKVIRCADVPFGSEFKGYKNYTVQGIVLEPYNVVSHMERWQMLDGKYVEAMLMLPKDVKCHFDVTLVSIILYQYHQCHVTQASLLGQIHEYGIDISAGQLDVILTPSRNRLPPNFLKRVRRSASVVFISSTLKSACAVRSCLTLFTIESIKRY